MVKLLFNRPIHVTNYPGKQPIQVEENTELKWAIFILTALYKCT